MNWYIAMVVYEIICGNGNHCPQFDEQVRLIRATDHSDALNIANQLGEQEAFSFTDQNQRLVQWKFLAVTELLPLREMAHGAEIFNHIIEIDHPDGYREKILNRSNTILQTQTDAIHSF